MEITSLDKSVKRNVGVLIMVQAILGWQMPMIFILAGLVGQSLATNICLESLPITMIVLRSLLAAPVLSTIMQRKGRKTRFFIGVFGGAYFPRIGVHDTVRPSN